MVSSLSRPMVEVTEREMAELIRASAGRPLRFAFGPGRTWLKDHDEESLALLERWRGISFENGAGI